MTSPASAAPARPLLLKLGGALLDDADALEATLAAAARMHCDAPGSIVIVHGGGSAVDRQLAAFSWTSQKRDGIRITPPEHMEQVAAVLAGSVNASLVARLLASGAAATGLTLASGFLARCSKRSAAGFDPGCVGAVTDGSPVLVDTLLRSGFLPVISSIAADAHGGLLNVNADDAAAALAGIIGARMLLFLTDVEGVRGPGGSIVPQLGAAQAQEWIALGTISGGMIPKVRGAIESATRGRTPVAIASWRTPGVLWRLARGEAVGTLVLPQQAATACAAGPAPDHAPCCTGSCSAQ